MVYDETAVYIVRDTLITVLKIAAPILASGVVVGLTISILQSITSIQEQTLTMVPKIATMATVAAILLPWIVSKVVAYAHQAFLLF